VTFRHLLLAPLLAVALVACTSQDRGVGANEAPATDASSPGPTAVDLEVFAAASLRKAMEQVEAAYEAANPGTAITVSTDSSTALETKIEQGAPADVFLSADTTNPQKLVDGGFASGPVTPFAGNTLAVIVPTDNPAGIRTPADLAQDGVNIVAAGAAVPITTYVTELLDHLSKQSGYPDDFAARYAANVVSREDNVAAVVAKVALGEGDAAIVYVTDAKGSNQVAEVAVPGAANVSATYGGVVVNASPDRDAAAAFLAWLAGPAGQAVLSPLGFVPAGR
jgi:molybdate transport system substrate-binding protein